jgi:hypothetical protein
MIRTIEQIFNTASAEEIGQLIDTNLAARDESPFWAEKVTPLTRAILSVLIPLREQKLLFNPEGKAFDSLTPELFLRYTDLANLKWLAFTLQKSNDAASLQRTKYSEETAKNYQPLELGELASYLSGYTVNLEDEWQDFPIAHYNVHIGVGDLIKKLIKR